jgi:tetratricopeptide (TPR) repeat protein
VRWAAGFVLTLGIAGVRPIAAQTAARPTLDALRHSIDAAMYANDTAALTATRQSLARLAAADSKNAYVLHYLGYAEYRTATAQRLQGRTKEAQTSFGDAITHLQQSTEYASIPENHALLAMIDGQLAALEPDRAPSLGMKMSMEMGLAERLGSSNPRVSMLRGELALFTPVAYGGGLARAENALQQAVRLFATDHPTSPSPDWGAAETQVWLGQTFERQKRPAEAREAYGRALAAQPGYRWVTDVLLPGLGRASR